MSLLALLALLLAPADVKVSMLDGQSRSGSLTAISGTEVSITENGTAATFPLTDVMGLEFPATKVASGEQPQSLILTDGSRVAGTSVARTAKQLTMESLSLGTLTFDSISVQAVRLQPDNPVHRGQWNTFLKRESDKDLLIVAKRDGSGLDFLAGVVSSVSAEKVEFLLDKETVPVPAARVYGVVFARSAAGNARPAALKSAVGIMTAHGDFLAAKSVTLEGDTLQVETGWGQSLTAAVDQVRNIDLSGGRVQFLSDLEPVEERFSGVDPEGSLLAGLVSLEQQSLLFGPRRDTTMERQSRIRLRGREYAKGLCLHSRTEISWALDRQFSSLDCIVGIDDEVAFNGDHAVALKIMGDGNVLFEKLIATTDEPLSLRVPLEGISTLAILVDFGDGNSTCDWLDLADAKLVIAKDAK